MPDFVLFELILPLEPLHSSIGTGLAELLR
jgi:hypothetical protein